MAETSGRGRVRLTPELETALAERLIEETARSAEAGKLGSYLLQLTPAFSPARHSLELDRLVEVFRRVQLAVELRNRNWVDDRRRETTLDWFADRGVTYVTVDAPPANNFQIMPPLDAVTNPSVAYLRAHGRNTKGYLTGRSVAERFAWQYTDEELEEIAGRARALAERRGRCTWRSTTTAATTPRPPRSASALCSGRRCRSRTTRS